MILPILHYTPLIKRGFLPRLLLITLIVVIVSNGSFVWAQNKSNLEKLSSPDVLVLVLSGMGQYDQVSISYSGEVSKDDAKKDLSVLAGNSKWAMRNQSVSTQAANTPGAKPTTSASFQVLPIVDARQGTIPLEPFIVTLKRFKTMQINYLVASQFSFRGLQSFEDEYVKINLKQSGNSYLYTVNVKDSNFDRLDLPINEESKVHRAKPIPVGARILLTVGLALVGAVLVYVVVAYLTKRREL